MSNSDGVGTQNIVNSQKASVKTSANSQRASDIALDILESIDDYISAFDRNWNFIYINKQCAQDFGLTPKDLLGKNFWKTFPRFIGTELEKNYTEAMNRREIRRFEWKTIYSNKGYREFTVFPSQEGITVYGVDISERKRAQEAMRQSEELFSKAFHGNPAALLITCVADNRFVDVNETCLQLLEYTRNEMVGHSSRELGFYFDYPERERVIAILHESGSVRNVEMQLKTKSGKVLNTLVSFEAVNINGERHFLSFIMDITEPKRLQRDLEEYAKNLEAIVEERTRQLKDKERLAAIGQTAGMVGHDLRNPLQSVVSSVFLIRKDLTALPQSAEAADISFEIESIHEQTEYMDKIISDLQDYARPLRPDLVESDVKSVIVSALACFDIPPNIEANAVFNDNLPTIRTDPLLLKRVLVNLATNAAQAMPSGGKLTVRAFGKDKRAFITVEDTGVGIPLEVQNKLFTPLFTTKSKGQGLGLAVVKRLVDALGGSIGFASEEGKGTKFVIELPI